MQLPADRQPASSLFDEAVVPIGIVRGTRAVLRKALKARRRWSGFNKVVEGMTEVFDSRVCRFVTELLSSDAPKE